jgi:predicted transcriptional regulator
MDELKSKLHELIDNTNDTIFLENIYRAMQQQSRLMKRNGLNDLSSEQLSQLNEPVVTYRGSNKPKDFLDELSPAQIAELHEANAQYERGETIPLEEVLEKLKRWSGK